MKRLIPVVFLVVLAAAAWGQQATADPYDEAAAILQSASSLKLASITGEDVRVLLSKVSVAIQRVTYVERARAASWMMPGLGELRVGDTVGGALFMTADLAVAAGTLVGWYFLLPPNVRFNALDYFNTPISTIRTTWESNTVRDYLPSAGVLAGGMVLGGVLRMASGAHAAREARENLASGKVTFEPRLEIGPRGGMMMGMHWRW